VACYDGRVWSVPRSPEGSAPFVAIERRRGMWGINVAATATRVSVPTFFDRAYLLERDAQGAVGQDVGPEPQPTYGCNWVAPHPTREEIAVTHDDGRVRILDASSGEPLRTYKSDTESLLMGATWHPSLPLLATIDFYGELLIYDDRTGRVAWRQDMGFGPGITVDHDPSGRWLAVGGYSWEARVLALGADGLPVYSQKLDAPNRGVVKSIAFCGPDRILVASGDGALVVHDRQGDRFVAARTIRGTPPMELSNGVVASPDGRVGYVVSRDQTVRAFDLGSGEPLGVGLAHVRGVKSVHVSECGKHLVTGAYDRTVLLWDASDLSVRLPPVRMANSGVSCVRWKRGRVFSCSFDGVVTCIDGLTGRLLWHRTAADAAGAA
jgi:WD40 repeat protein